MESTGSGQTETEMQDMVQLKEEIRELVMDNGALVFGVASMEEVNKRCPPGYRPEDYLEGAQSVIMFGFILSSSGAIAASQATTQSISAHHGMKHCFATNYLISLALEKKHGYLVTGLPGLPATGDFDPNISLKACAEAAGLGMRALSTLIINPKYGPRLFYSGVVTTAKLPADEPLTRNPCPAPECVLKFRDTGSAVCQDSCPANAISGELNGRKIKHTRYDQLKCMPLSLISHSERFTRMFERVLDEEDKMKRKMILFGTEFQRCLYDLYWAGIEGRGTCWICQEVCPVGMDQIDLK